MKIQGFKKVETNYEATFRTPFPVVASEVTVDGKKADLVVSLKEGSFEVDGATYSGELLWVLAKEDAETPA